MFKNYRELFNTAVEYYSDNIPDLQISDDHRADSLIRLKRKASSSIGQPRGQVNEDQAESVSHNLFDNLTKQLFGNEDNDIAINGSFDTLTLKDFWYILLFFLCFVVGKRSISGKIRKSSYIDKFNLRRKDRERLEECVWRLIFYGFSSTCLVYSCFFRRHQGQQILDPDEKVLDYSLKIDLDEYLICMMEISFYLHATYALCFEDIWRHDSIMMLIHHIVAAFSVLTVYATRVHKIGLTAIVLRDTCDVLLEATKLVMCFRIQNKKVVRSMETSVKICMTIFTFAFFVNQLYYYPLFCLYHGLNFLKMHKLRSSMVTAMVTGCLIFLILDLMWSLLIIRLYYRLFTKCPMKDLREYEDDEGEEEDVIEDSTSGTNENNSKVHAD